MSVERIIGRLGLLVGVLLLTMGIALLFLPDTATSLPLSMMVADLAAVGALLLVLWTVRTRYRTKQNQTLVPDVEFPLFTSTPGDEIDDLIYRMTKLREGTIEYRERIHDRLTEVAVAVIMYRQNCSREEAIQRLEEGTWQPDGAESGYFSSPTGDGSLAEQLKRKITGGKTGYEQQLGTTIRALEQTSEFFDETPASPDEDGPEQALTRVDSEDPDAGELVGENVRYRSLISTHHWTGLSAFALATLALGILGSEPALLLGSAAAIAVAGYARAVPVPSLTDLEVSRTASDETPEPGDEVEMTVTVENTGDAIMPDLKLIDRLPPTMKVVEGSPRLGTALRSGQTATFKYTLVVERGEYSWPLQVIARNMSGSLERDARIDPETVVECTPRLRTTTEMPVRLQTSMYAGEVNTKTGGDGLEFYSIRDYQPGDPKRRIDWKTYARTGEFSTIDFREENAARVVLLFDARDSSYVSASPGEKHAMNRSVDAGIDVFASLYDQGHLLGIAAFNGIPCWLGPNRGQQHLQRARQLFLNHPALSPLPPDLAEEEEGRYIDPLVHIRRQLPENTQIFLFSPLTDHYTFEVARRLNGAGHLITVISPDPTASRTIGQRIARLERAVRVKQLRDHGIRVVDWDGDQTLNLELEHARRRWEA